MTTAAEKRVLVTGAAGYIAQINLPALEERYDLTLIDTREHTATGKPVPGIQRYDLLADMQGGYHPSERLRALVREVDAIFHCAYVQSDHWAPDGYEQERLNVDMAAFIFRLAWEEGVRRIVCCSSNHAADWYEKLLRSNQLEHLGPEAPPYSDNWYGWAKIAIEQIGFLYASGLYGRPIETVMLRIGAPRLIDASRFAGNPAGYRRDLGAWISDRDFQQLVIKSLETPDVRNEWGVPFQIFYGISNNTRAFWSIANARRIAGYTPQDDSEVQFADDIRRLLIETSEGGRLSSTSGPPAASTRWIP
ncbi:MAG: NAD(P)-dependent oxidoreductase [Chloroflexi bacterium]|nr:NAD(P)-dependent oxidoreductase [Chloroflexota bacterium]